MAGLISTMQAEGKLQQIEQMVEQKVPPAKKDQFNRLVLAGMKVMFDKKSHKLVLQEIKDDPIQGAGEGVAKLMGLLSKQAKGKFPFELMMPAGMWLLCEALTFVERTGRQVSDQDIAIATQALMNGLMNILGLDDQKLQSLLSNTKQVMADPQKRAQYEASQKGA